MKKNNKPVAIIFARGNSKRISKKNIKIFNKKPIISYSIKAALKSKIFQKVIVSTDNKEIATIAKKYGAETPFIRPYFLADDYTPINEVIKHAIIQLKKNNVSFHYVCGIFATAPLIQIKHLKRSFMLLRDTGSPYVIPISEFSFPIQRALRVNNKDQISIIVKKNYLKRSQDLEKTYHEAGQFIWGKASAFIKNIPTYMSNSTGYRMPSYLTHDIDNEDDWIQCEIKYNILKKLNLVN